MDIRPEEISSVIKDELLKYKTRLRTESVGTVLRVGDGIAIIYGLDDAMAGELIKFPDDTLGMIFNLEEESVGVVIFGDEKNIKEGDVVKRTYRVAEVPVGEAVIGRVINPFGNPIDNKGAVALHKKRSLEAVAPGVIERQPVKEPLMTGVKAIDSMIPIGRGQRELIIGDRQTGKTALVIDTILNQKGKDVYCIYVAIGQKMSNIVAVAEILEKYGAMKYTTIISASSRAPASTQYLAPFAACAIGEEFMYSGKHALVIYDDLTKHAQAYRQLSLLLRRPPGREAYPGDIFYLHARLLERAAKLTDELGGGSLTAIPIIETQAGDITSYIPTNVISITDGQIYLETDLFYTGVKPAINVGLSVSRVGGNAQVKIMKQIAGMLRLDLAQYRELSAFAQFGAELDAATQSHLNRGERMVEVLKQKQLEPLSLAKEIMIIYAGTKGYLDDLPASLIGSFEVELYKYMDDNHPNIAIDIESQREMTNELSNKLDDALRPFKEEFKKRHKAV